MDKKGFTLIEVIGVVIILASIVLIITPNINNSLKNSKNKAFDVQIEEIKSATKSWVALNSENTPKEDNEEEISSIIKYFEGISEWLYFNFEFLEYFKGYDDLNDEVNYNKKIELLKLKLNN